MGYTRHSFNETVDAGTSKHVSECFLFNQKTSANAALKASLRKNVGFAPNKVVLTKQGEATLHKVAQVLKQYPYLAITVEGLSSAAGSGGQKLVDGRVKVAKHYLKSLGVTNKMYKLGKTKASMIGIKVFVTGAPKRPADCHANHSKYDIVHLKKIVTKTSCVPVGPGGLKAALRDVQGITQRQQVDSMGPEVLVETSAVYTSVPKLVKKYGKLSPKILAGINKVNSMHAEVNWKIAMKRKALTSEAAWKRPRWVKSAWYQGLNVQEIMSMQAWMDATQREASSKEAAWKAAARNAEAKSRVCPFDPTGCWYKRSVKKAVAHEVMWKRISWKKMGISTANAADSQVPEFTVPALNKENALQTSAERDGKKAAIQAASYNELKMKSMGETKFHKMQMTKQKQLPLWLPLSQTTGQDQERVQSVANPKKAAKLAWMASQMQRSVAERVEDEKGMGVWEHAPNAALQVDKNAWVKLQLAKAKAAKKEAHHKQVAYMDAGKTSEFFEVMDNCPN